MEKVALVSCEVIGLKAEVISRIRKALPPELDLPPERLVITCTHTHGAPVIEGDYLEFLIGRIIEAITAAGRDLKARHLRGGSVVHEEWVGFNRRNLETGFLPVDREVPFLTVSKPDGRLRAILFHYACHPSVLGPHNRLITADWPGFTRKGLQERLGDDVAVLYLKGTEGNINTGYSAGVSSLGIKIPTRTYETAERVGSVIATALFSALKEAELIESSEIRFESRRIDIPYRSVEKIDEARRQLAWWGEEVERIDKEGEDSARLLNARVERAYAGFKIAALEHIQAEGRPSRSCEQIAFRIGAAGFLSFPGEFFVESGLQTKRDAVSQFTFPLGITNDYIGYVPTEEAFREGGYEVACARFSPRAAAQWTCTGVDLLNHLF